MDDLIESLKILLGTGFALYLKTHAAHWNVVGGFFPSYHVFLEDMYKNIWKSLDDIAEQIRQLDAFAPGTLERMIKLSRISGDNTPLPAREMMAGLYKDQETFIAMLTEVLHKADEADKQGLVNFLAGRIEVHSKMRWQLRATANQLRDDNASV